MSLYLDMTMQSVSGFGDNNHFSDITESDLSLMSQGVLQTISEVSHYHDQIVRVTEFATMQDEGLISGSTMDSIERLYGRTFNVEVGCRQMTLQSEVTMMSGGWWDAVVKFFKSIVEGLKKVWLAIENFFRRLFGFKERSLKKIEEDVKKAESKKEADLKEGETPLQVSSSSEQTKKDGAGGDNSTAGVGADGALVLGSISDAMAGDATEQHTVAYPEVVKGLRELHGLVEKNSGVLKTLMSKTSTTIEETEKTITGLVKLLTDGNGGTRKLASKLVQRVSTRIGRLKSGGDIGKQTTSFGKISTELTTLVESIAKKTAEISTKKVVWTGTGAQTLSRFAANLNSTVEDLGIAYDHRLAHVKELVGFATSAVQGSDADIGKYSPKVEESIKKYVKDHQDTLKRTAMKLTKGLSGKWTEICTFISDAKDGDTAEA